MVILESMEKGDNNVPAELPVEDDGDCIGPEDEAVSAITGVAAARPIEIIKAVNDFMCSS